MAACGWLPSHDKNGFTSFTPLYALWQPPRDLWQLCIMHYPRLVEQTWGSDTFCTRTDYVAWTSP